MMRPVDDDPVYHRQQSIANMDGDRLSEDCRNFRTPVGIELQGVLPIAGKIPKMSTVGNQWGLGSGASRQLAA
jgi:hypothetical protein